MRTLSQHENNSSVQLPSISEKQLMSGSKYKTDKITTGNRKSLAQKYGKYVSNKSTTDSWIFQSSKIPTEVKVMPKDFYFVDDCFACKFSFG
jgi:hypothetical protein